MSERTKFILDESQIPAAWYNVIPDLPAPPPPPLHPGTLQPVGPDDLAPLFPMELIRQEVTGDSYVDIPGAVLDVYKLWRPTPLFRARRLEKLLNTPARIYYKYEGVSPAGSHKPNTAVPQAYYNSIEGTKRLTTETGAGPVGQRAGVRLRPVRHRLRDLDGPRVLRPEAAPAHDDADLGRDRAPVAVAGHPGGAVGARGGPGFARVPGHRDQRGGRGGGRVRRDAVRARLACSTTCSCTRRSSGRRRWSSSSMAGEARA